MSRTTPALALLAAFAGGSAQAAVALDAEIEKRAEGRAVVSQRLRAIEVELYCDHRSEAMGLMLQARRALLASREGTTPQALVEIDKLILHVRRGETEQAIAALEGARERLNT